MRSTEAVIGEIIEAYQAIGGEYVRIEEIAKRAGLSREEIAEAIEELIEDEDFRAEPQPFGHRITDWERENAPVIGDEARHLICWG